MSKKNQIQSNKKTTQQNSRAHLYWLLAIVVLTFIAYIPALRNGFTNWDDNYYITDNPLIKEWSLGNIASYFTQFHFGLYQPLTLLSLALDFKMAGMNPFLFHLNNVLLHIINTALVFFLFRRLTGKIEIAIITAALFGIHTLHVESVSWIIERKDLLMGLFFLGSLLCYCEYVNRNKTKFYVAALLLFVFAILSKAQAVTLALTLFAIDYLLNRKLTGKKVLVEKIPFLAVALFFGIVAMYSVKTSGATIYGSSFGLFDGALIAGYGLVNYILKLFLPVNLSALYPLPVSITWEYWLCFITAIVMISLFVFYIKRSKIITFGILFFVINIFMVLQFVPLGAHVMADRFVYIPSIGFFFIIAGLYSQFSGIKMGQTSIYVPVLALYVLLLTVLTYHRNKVWKDSLTLWNDAASKYPDSFVILNNRGLTRHELGDYNGTIFDLTKAISLAPNHADSYHARGLAKSKTRDFKGALNDFNKAISLKPDDSKTYLNRGLARSNLGDMTGAVADYTKAIELKPANALAYANRGVALYNAGKYSESISDLEKAIALEKTEAHWYYNLGNSRAKAGDLQGALSEYNSAIKVNGNYAEAYFNRGIIKIQLGYKDDGFADQQRAYQLGLKRGGN